MSLPGINCYTGVATGIVTGALNGPACSVKRTRRTIMTIVINSIKATCA